MSKKHIIAFVGMPGSGKSTCVKYLVDKGYPSVYFGGITVDEVKARGLEVNEKNEKIVREDLRKVEGKGVMATRIIEKIDSLLQQNHLKIIADGLYSWSEYKIFKEKYGDNVSIIAIAAPRNLRHKWLSSRAIRPLTEKELTTREYAEIENIEKGGPIANADFTVVNDGSTEQMLEKVENILKQIGFFD